MLRLKSFFNKTVYNIKKRLQKASISPWYFLLPILLIGVILRISNLNYNSPSNDESIYIMIGNLGFFEHNWWLFNAKAWMAGSQYVYPVITAIANSIGGIVASRLINVIFGLLAVITIFHLSGLLSGYKNFQKYVAGSISAFLVAVLPVSLYISRLATYDMPSFFFFFLGLYFLVSAEKNKEAAKNYFLSAVFFMLASFTKIFTGFYIPLIIGYSFYNAYKNKLLNDWKIYFLVPIVILTFVYIMTFANIFPSLFQSQTLKIGDIVGEFITSMPLIGAWVLVGTIGMIIKKDLEKWLVLSSGALYVLLIHFSEHSLLSLEKHAFISIFFLSIIAGVGFSHIASLLIKSPVKFKKQRIWPYVALSGVIVTIIAFAIAGQGKVESLKYDTMWENSDVLSQYVASIAKPGDKILTEEGTPIILSTYGINNPENISTYDWFKYKNDETVNAYGNATHDGYFNIIQINSADKLKSDRFTDVHNQIWQNLGENYQLTYRQGSFYVYERK